MKKIITTILALTLLSAFSMSCSKGFSFYDLGGTWVGSGGSFSIDTSAKTINKGNTTYTISENIPETKAQLLNIMLLKDGSNAGTITFTSKTEANGTGDFNGSWTKQ
ncbi:hypothetical protein [Brachyspira murdochii]|uniref:hypothetical protein n=1 Tax=Brachyspira murdochii TaxID=84378 RepID=UPI0012F4FD91|nr:hypothetical protein [Brachyspira murdochii]